MKYERLRIIAKNQNSPLPSILPWCRPVESTFCELHLTHGAETEDSISSFYVCSFQTVSTEGFTP